VNTLACAALAAWARTAATHAARIAEIAAARRRLTAALAALPGVRVWPSAANFLLLRVLDGPALLERLAAASIAVRRCDTFPGLSIDHLRVAVREPSDNQRLLDAIRDALLGSAVPASSISDTRWVRWAVEVRSSGAQRRPAGPRTGASGCEQTTRPGQLRRLR
jgi:histidinol-phosphate aminotransferase